MPIAHLPCLLAGIDHMGRSRKRLKTESFDDRKYTTIPVTANGRTSYPKIHLRTKDEDVARRRLTVRVARKRDPQATPVNTSVPTKA